MVYLCEETWDTANAAKQLEHLSPPEFWATFEDIMVIFMGFHRDFVFFMEYMGIS